LSPAFQEQSRTLVIEAEVDNQHGKLRPGSFAKAEIQSSSTSDVVMVPSGAIVTFAGIQKVFTIKDGKAVEKNVIVGRYENDWVVVDGIEPDQPVVISPGNLITGQPVTVAPQYRGDRKQEAGSRHFKLACLLLPASLFTVPGRC
jgi:multidrug efflux pump subunit AcrA (membrane-fusion protein)